MDTAQPSPLPKGDEVSTENTVTKDLLKEFRETMKTSHKDFVFACGGSIPITTPNKTEKAPVEATASLDPVTIRWDPQDNTTLASQCSLTFPPEEPSTEDHPLSSLKTAMQAATFGLGGKDVYDETYRKALKLDNTNFSTSFCPYNAGIMDTISQILLPTFSDTTTIIAKAELYKLNIYEGPSGHFRSHVDTPRSSSQFGSLVVCLPATHSGGELQVRHNGKTMTFDWGSSPDPTTTPTIQWAAFYSDCEHEVLQVRSGHRLTLTYNLYASTPNPPNPTNSLNLPLTQHMHSLLSNKHFLPTGGHLGFYTSHAYPHTSRAFNHSPFSPPLKGIDRALWETLPSLGCRVSLRPILDFNDWWTSQYDDEHRVPLIGTDMNCTAVEGQIEGEDDMEWVMKDWKKDRQVEFGQVEWLNTPDVNNREVQLAYTVVSFLVLI